MYSDHELRLRVRAALEDVTPAAPWLEHGVHERLHEDRGRRWRRPLTLVAALVVLALLAFAAYELVTVFPAPVPARDDPQTAAYTELVRTNEAALATAEGEAGCFNQLSPACAAKANDVLWRSIAFHDALSKATPPNRFARVHSHLLSDLDTLINATRDYPSNPAAMDDGWSGIKWETSAIVGHETRPDPVAYRVAVSAVTAGLGAESPTGRRQDALTLAGARQEAWIADDELARVIAPAAYTRADAALKADLQRIDQDVERADGALNSGDQPSVAGAFAALGHDIDGFVLDAQDVTA